MKAYIAKRLLQFIPVLIGISILIFGIMRIVPGDVALSILIGDGSGTPDPAAYDRIRADLGLDKSYVEQYFDWVGGFFVGDLGDAIFKDKTVLQEIGDSFPLTFQLATLTVIISLVISLPLGVLMAVRQNTWIDYVARIVTIGGLALPNFFVAALMLLVMVVWFEWIPPIRPANFWDDPWINFQQVIWAALALGYLLSAVVARMTRSALLEVLRQDYIRTAWAKGLTERAVVVRHALKNAFLPVVTIVGLQYAALIGGTVIMERFWNLPGLGFSLVEAIIRRDFPIVQGIVMMFSAIVLIANLIVDILYAWLDPRVRYG